MQSCRACFLAKQSMTRRQAKMVQWHPATRFHTVAVDIMETYPTSRNGYGKVVVIGDLSTWLVVTVPVKDESASTIANILFGSVSPYLDRHGVCSATKVSLLCL
jgi:hypothetical protein